jgi:tripartite-type tricarboxylate transporter receptor subunit TctC
MKIRKSISILLSLVLILALFAGCGSKDTSSNQGGDSSNSSGSTDTAKKEPAEEPKKDPFYQAKNLEIIVPFGAGGGTDTFGRFIASYIGKHTEGEPAIQVLNIPGGGSVNGANEFVKVRKHDGYTALLTSGSTHLPYLLGEPAVQYDLKGMVPLLAAPQGGAVYASSSTGISNPKDALNPKEPLIYAGISATGNDLVTLLSFKLLGMNVKPILGYDGRGPSRVAFEQGESNIDYQTVSAYNKNVKLLVEEGKAIPLYSFGMLDENGDVIRDPAFPDLPSVKEVYKEIHGKDPSGIEWDAYKVFLGAGFSVQKVLWLHSDAPQEAVDALAKAGQGIASDAEFNEKAEEALGGYELITGKKLEGAIKTITSASDEVLDWVHNYLEQDLGIKRLK